MAKRQATTEPPPEAAESSTSSGDSSPTTSSPDELAPDEAARAVLEELGDDESSPDVPQDDGPSLVDRWRDELRPIVGSVNVALGSAGDPDEFVDPETGDIDWSMSPAKAEAVVNDAAEVAAARGWEPRKAFGSILGLLFTLADHFGPRLRYYRDSQPAEVDAEPTRTRPGPRGGPRAQPSDVEPPVAPDAPIRPVAP